MMISFKTKQCLFLIIVAASLGYVIWNSPLTVDDLYYEAYGLRRIGEIFHFAIAYGNGRLFGNMLIHYILRSPIIRTILQTIGVLALWVLTYETAQPTKTESFYVCIALFVAISPTIFREDYLWSSAFANYIPGIIFMFLPFYLVRKSSEIRRNIYIYIILVLISIAGQLFVEHTSLINIVFAFCVLCYFLVTKATKIKIVLSSIWFGGTVAGMGIMLLIPKLFYVANEWENYQKVNFNSLHDLVISVVANGMQIAGIYLQNVFALIILSIVVITLTNTRKIAKMILLLVPIYGFAVNYIIDDIWDGTICGMISLLLLLLYVMTVVIVIYKEESIAAKMQSLFFIGMSIFAVLPLLVVYPIGSRCLLHSYVFLVLAILSIINNNNAVKVNSNKEIIRLCIVATCLLLCFLTIHFHKIGNIDQARQKYVQDMVVGGAEKIIVPRIPSIYIRENNGWSYGQVFYCEEKQDVAFEFVDYNTWKINIGEEIYGRYLE